jgi:hypothetical protein
MVLADVAHHAAVAQSHDAIRGLADAGLQNVTRSRRLCAVPATVDGRGATGMNRAHQAAGIHSTGHGDGKGAEVDSYREDTRSVPATTWT